MKFQLVVIRAGGKRGARLTVVGRQAVLGRGARCAVRIPSAEVSREHCLLRWQDGTLTVQDLGSANGTFLNGVLIEASEEVRPGDTLEVGPVKFRVDYDAEAVEPLDVLEELAQGDLADEDSEEPLEVVDDETVEPLELVEDEETDEHEPKPRRARPQQPIPLVGESPVPVDVDELTTDEGEAWHLEAGPDMRGLLEGLDDEDNKKSRKKGN